MGFIDFTIRLIGRGRATLGEWPHQEIVQAAVATIRDCGGELYRQGGTPAGELEVLYFRVGGRRLRLCVEDYGNVRL